MLKTLALALIGLYQRHLSPRKGFACAYRVARGQASCSRLGARVIRRHGVWRGLKLLDERLRRCGQAARDLQRWQRPRLTPQHGVCDCGGCDLPGVDGLCGSDCQEPACRVLSCLGDVGDCGCDWRRRGESQRR